MLWPRLLPTTSIDADCFLRESSPALRAANSFSARSPCEASKARPMARAFEDVAPRGPGLALAVARPVRCVGPRESGDVTVMVDDGHLAAILAGQGCRRRGVDRKSVV